MMKNLIFSALFLYSLNSLAFLYVEPEIGMILSGSSESKSRFTGSTSFTSFNAESDYSEELNYGFRLGLTALDYYAGLGWSRSKIFMEHEVSGNTTQISSGSTGSDFSNSKYSDVYEASYKSLFVGKKVLPFLKVSASYYFNVTFEDVGLNDDTSDVGLSGHKDELIGKGWGLGVAYSGFKTVDLGIRYRSISMDKYNNQSLESVQVASTGEQALGNDNVFQEFTTNEILFVVSFPWDVFNVNGGGGSSSN